MLVNVILSALVFLLHGIKTLESASTFKRIVYQTFFDNLLTTCYGTCIQSPTEFTGVTRNVRCEGNKVRLKCEPDHIIRVSVAFYGALEPGQELCKDASTVLEQCRKDVSSIVRNDCNQKDLCLFSIDKERFGKFCQAKYFYLDIRHHCEFRPSTMENTHFPTTTSSAVTTRLKTTTERATKLKPITIYREQTSKSSGIRTRDFEGESTSSVYTTKGRRQDDRETKSSQSVSSTSQSSSSTTSSSSPVTTHVPMASPGTSIKGTTPGMSPSAPDLNAPSATNSGRQAGKKATLYWLLTAHSLVSDKNFVKANSTHLALAVILSIFVALVLSVCFVLDHCRREKRKRALSKLRESENEANRLENGSPIAFDLRRGSARPKNGSSYHSAVVNGGVKRSIGHSLDDLNHNSEDRDDRLPLISSSAGQRGRDAPSEEVKESAFIMRSSTLDLLPSPPDELLADTPQFDKAGFLDGNESETSTLSIPPPVGFGDFDADQASLKPANFQPVVKVTSPTPTNSSVSSSHAGTPSAGLSLRTMPKIENSKRLNNEFLPETPTLLHDSNLLQNSVSVQTNDLRDGYDRQSKIENPGHVSMRSPQFEASDVYATTDKVSNVGFINLHEISAHDSENIKPKQRMKKERNHIPSIASVAAKSEATAVPRDSKIQQNEATPKRGRLLIMKSPGDCERRTDSSAGMTAEKEERYRAEHAKAKSIEDVLLESGKGSLHECASVDAPHTLNGTLKKIRREEFNLQRNYNSNTSKSDRSRDRQADGKPDLKGEARADTMSETSSCTSNLDSENAALPRYDEASKQVFAVPRHRCGMGHKHPCACIPLRTGSSSFICACLEKAKQKSSRCCKEGCTDENSGLPYSSQRPLSGRGLATETMKRKAYNGNLKRVSSLEDLSSDKKLGKPLVVKGQTSKGGMPGISFDLRKHPEISQHERSKTLPILQSKLKQKAGVESAKTLSRSFERDTVGRHESKMIPVIVHSSSKMRGNAKPRFEKNVEKFEAKGTNSRSGIPRSIRSEDSDSSDRSDSIDGQHSKSLPSTPTSARRNKNGRLSPICETTSRKTIDKSNSDTKSWPKRSPKFRIQVVESIHYDKRQRSNEV